MSNKKDSLGDRMKTYEAVPKVRLVRRMPAIIRLDGKAFHTFTKGFMKPFDTIMMKTMQDTMKYLCENIQGCVLGYTQSDEISLVLIDYQTLTTDAWFEYNVEKMCSIAASMATLAFNKAFYQNVDDYFNCDDVLSVLYGEDTEERSRLSRYAQTMKTALSKGALFDARVFNVPKEDVMNCITWRQQDATRNSIQAVGQANFSHKELLNKSCNQIQDMLFTEKGINWNDFPIPCKRGTCCIKEPVTIPCSDGRTIQRNKWVLDLEIPIFNQKPQYINDLVLLRE